MTRGCSFYAQEDGNAALQLLLQEETPVLWELQAVGHQGS